MKKHGLCLIGGGFIGKKYAEAFSRLPNVSPVVICDVNRQNAEEIASRFGFRRIETNWHHAIDTPEIDIVCICVPNCMHYDIAANAIECQKNILCEKPLSQSAQDSILLSQMASNKRIIASCGYNLIYLPAIEYAKKIVDSGTLGELVSFKGYYDNDRLSNPEAPFEWRLSKSNSIGGSISDLGINIIAISQFLFGEIKSVIGVTNIIHQQRKDINGMIKDVENDDLAQFLVKYKDGAIGSISCNRIAVGSKQDMGFTAHFTNGTIRFSMEHMNEIHICTSKDFGFSIINSSNGRWFSTGYEELKNQTVERFISNIDSNTEPDTDFDFASKIDQVIEAVLQSSTVNQWIDL